ncbi:MAG: GNAT family N-acetyltransferase [Anaerolineae bacterium]|jgi:ribosomal protein S18 acetylase RimI-like enzyme|nr:GNAT family N-acetyltransferase [Anaerolineae bacterium]
MTTYDQITIGLPAHLHSQAATLFYEAFGRKLNPILGNDQRAIAIIQAGLDPNCCISAYEGDHLLGVAGFCHDSSQLVTIRIHSLIQHFGLIRGVWRFGLSFLGHRRPVPGELLMDGIAVSRAARGRGIGTQLLDRLYQFAREHGYQSIRLDVIDTNPDARRLYERVGFVATKTQEYPYLKSLGFTAVTTMRREVR